MLKATQKAKIIKTILYNLYLQSLAQVQFKATAQCTTVHREVVQWCEQRSETRVTASVLKQWCEQPPKSCTVHHLPPSDPRDFTNELYIAQRFQPTDDDVASTITQSSQPIPSLDGGITGETSPGHCIPGRPRSGQNHAVSLHKAPKPTELLAAPFS